VARYLATICISLKVAMWKGNKILDLFLFLPLA